MAGPSASSRLLPPTGQGDVARGELDTPAGGEQVHVAAGQAPPGWDERLLRLRVHAPFQRAGWISAKAAGSELAVFVSGPGYQSAGILAETSAGTVFTCPRGPAFRDLDSLARAIRDLGGVFTGCELRVGPYRTGAVDVHAVEAVLGRLGLRPAATQFHRFTATVTLDDEAAMLARLSQNARRQLRKAQGAGVEVRATASRAAAVRFVDFYAEFARRRGIPSIEQSFATRLADWFQDTGAGTYLFLEKAGDLRSAALLLTAGDLGWISRSPTASHEPQGVALYWSSLCWLHARGSSRCDLGGVPSADNGQPLAQGLTRFKLSLGAVLTPVVDEHVAPADGRSRGTA